VCVKEREKGREASSLNTLITKRIKERERGGDFSDLFLVVEQGGDHLWPI